MKEYKEQRPDVFEISGNIDSVRSWERIGGKVETDGFVCAIEEYTQLREGLANLKIDEDLVSNSLFDLLKSSSGDQIELEVIKNWRIVGDLVEFAKRVEEAGEVDEVESRANLILFEDQKRLVKYVPVDVHRLLQDSRSIGLRPLGVTDKLRELKIACLGLSAASPTIDLLVAAGAENIVGFDGGKIDPSNIPRFVGPMASEEGLGHFKAERLSRGLYARNPYGNYHLSPGRVVVDESEMRTKDDILLKDFAVMAQLILEVVDDVYLKSRLDSLLVSYGIDLPVMFMADLTRPVAGLNYPSMGNHFNQPLDKDRLKQMSNKKLGIHPLSLVVEMIGDNLPSDHILQFLVMRNGLMPYWSQLPESSRELASLSVYLIEAFLDGRNVLGRNYDISNVPRHLMENLTGADARLVQTLKKNGFGF